MACLGCPDATLFASTAIANEPLDRVCRAAWLLLFSMVAVLLLITVPSILIFPPQLVNSQWARHSMPPILWNPGEAALLLLGGRDNLGYKSEAIITHNHS